MTVLTGGWLAAAGAPLGWTAAEHDGRVEARRGDSLVMAWQRLPLAQPKGGAKFAGSAFFHPLRTLAGFEWTTIQPGDHLHHFGLWWPWKFIEVGGQRYNCWEIQEGQGGYRADSAKQLSTGPDAVTWEFKNSVVVKPKGAGPLTAIRETAKVTLAMHGADAIALDISLDQQVAGEPVTIVAYRYSGFSWRGPMSWNKTNSEMLTSDGHVRDTANGQTARWVVVSGPTPKGTASVLLMSAAIEPQEKLRVWGGNMSNGMPFVNFNPVMAKSLPLDAAHPEVAKRRYRVIAADRKIDPAGAEAEWKAWLGR